MATAAPRILSLATAALFALPAAGQQSSYIPLVSKGFQHHFWQAFKAVAEQAA